ncbi:unnamed protein product [Kluyveromyces dobzhanskii CBS 2104]|uniref:WGS project CCBQ000000000 data, contig 00102 n=1 Tax=Kluyveromyces dobzhanskii CBS 2104 TaxID=1427455 RepID=A0A0A8L6D0_9SACH|nr:unnamed protein product [Kluyveromyces dobzhanskii CBS 2104]
MTETDHNTPKLGELQEPTLSPDGERVSSPNEAGSYAENSDNRISEITNEADKPESTPVSIRGDTAERDYDYDEMMDSDEELRSQLKDLTESVRESLPTEDLPDTTLEYAGHVYPVFAKDSDDTSQSVAVISDKSFIHTELNFFIAAVRLFLQTKYGALALASKEILLHFPNLDLVCDEDNIYIKKMTMDDILSIFRVLRANSLKNGEENVPSTLRMIVTLQPRFVSRYNDLVEVMDNNGSFAVAHGFSNDESHPVLVDEGNQDNPVIRDRGSGVIVMDSDEASLKGSDSDIEILN